MSLDIDFVRRQFPALDQEGIYLDNPGGSQIAKHALKRAHDYLIETNSNRGGAFATSRATDSIIAQSRQAVAAFVNAARAEEIVFGPNMTSLTLTLSRSIAQLISPSDEIIVTRMDHDANISPWLQVAEATGCTVQWVDFDKVTGRLDLDQLRSRLNKNTRLVAVGYASNALGTVNPIGDICKMSAEVGAWTYIDAVQLAPHHPIDVQALGCDFLAVSGYKLFAPHVGFAYGRHELLDKLPAFKVRPAPEAPPGKFEPGTQNHEGIAGLLGSMEYLAELGRRYGGAFQDDLSNEYQGLALDLKAGMKSIEAYEEPLTKHLLNELSGLAEVQVYGPSTTEARVPTVSFRIGELQPRRVAELLGDLGIYVWDGNFYALAVTEHLGIESQGGLIRVGMVHYNTADELDRLINGLKSIMAG